MLSPVVARKLPFPGFTSYYGAAALFAKVFLFFRGFGTLPNKQKSPSFPVRDSGDFTERVPLSYACCVTFISSEAPPDN